jgi:TonB family protein
MDPRAPLTKAFKPSADRAPHREKASDPVQFVVAGALQLLHIMNELNLGHWNLAANGTIPEHRRVTASVYTLAVFFHIALFASLVWAGRIHPVRVASGQMMSGGIAAWIPASIGGPAAAHAPAPVAEPKKPAPAPRAAKPAQAVDQSAAAGQSGTGSGTIGVGAGSGPVRLGAGGNVTLLKRVQPIYPRQMESMRITGTVVLDAIIRRDGTIGDVTILQSSNALFAQSAVTAVKQWRYTELPYEGILTVTVNFTLPS